MPALRGHRLALLVLAVGALADVALFLALHAGPGGSSVCESHGYSDAGSLSWWPLGTSCAGGLPVRSTVVLHGGFLAFAVVLLLPGLGLLLARLHDRARSGVPRRGARS